MKRLFFSGSKYSVIDLGKVKILQGKSVGIFFSTSVFFGGGIKKAIEIDKAMKITFKMFV